MNEHPASLFCCVNSSQLNGVKFRALLRLKRLKDIMHSQQFQSKTLRNKSGMSVTILNYGALIQSIKVPANKQELEMVLGFEDPEQYLCDNFFLGATIGRYCNRIGGGKATYNGETYKFTQNDTNNCLHGGKAALDKKFWVFDVPTADDNNSVSLSCTSEDGEEGFPGNLNVKVTFTLTDDNEIKIQYYAETDKPTLVNMTNHSYFNLSGVDSGKNITGHMLQVNADRYTPVNQELVPNGELAPVEDTPFDFREPTMIRERLSSRHVQMVLGKGLDHNFVLNAPKTGEQLTRAGVAKSEETGITLTVHTDTPGMQVYTGNYLNNKFQPRQALCLETQNFPDSPNIEHFPSSWITPEQPYRSETHYVFSF